jgi:plasmid stabilization system protein ParE
MKSIMTDVAKQQIRQIAKYIRKEFGKTRRDEFMLELRQ